MVKKVIATIAVIVLVIGIAFALGIIGYFLSQGTRNANSGGEQTETVHLKSRHEAIPPNAVKITPQSDAFPQILQTDEWDTPIPLPGPVNTAGAEDSPFMTPDGAWFFFITPDLSLPAERQLRDDVTGIYRSQRAGSNWTEPQRIILGSYESLDGCEFVQDNVMWFCSVRVGNYRAVDAYTAQYVNGCGRA